MLAAIRPSSWNPLLFIHIAGAMALVATLVVAMYALRVATARGDQQTTRFAFRSLLVGVLPAYVVMRVGAQLIVDMEYLSGVHMPRRISLSVTPGSARTSPPNKVAATVASTRAPSLRVTLLMAGSFET